MEPATVDLIRDPGVPPAVPPARERPLPTRLLLLVELHRQRHAKLQGLADRLGVTVQAVSAYLKRLQAEGLVERAAGAWRPTHAGTEHLHDRVSDLRRFLDDTLGNLRLIDETVAMAGGRIRSGDAVGLYLREGRLHASSRSPARSRGRAAADAEPGELVLVTNLQGVLELRPGPLTLLAHPPFPDASGLQRARREVRRLRNGTGRLLVAAHALASVRWAQRLGLRVDLEFAPLAAAQDAARRGVPVLYLVPKDELAPCLARLQEAEVRSPERLPIRSVTV